MFTCVFKQNVRDWVKGQTIWTVTHNSLKLFQSRMWSDNMHRAQVISSVPWNEILSELQSLLYVSILCSLNSWRNTRKRKWKLWFEIGQFGWLSHRPRRLDELSKGRCWTEQKSEICSCCTLFGYRVYENLNHITSVRLHGVTSWKPQILLDIDTRIYAFEGKWFPRQR